MGHERRPCVARHDRGRIGALHQRTVEPPRAGSEDATAAATCLGPITRELDARLVQNVQGNARTMGTAIAAAADVCANADGDGGGRHLHIARAFLESRRKALSLLAVGSFRGVNGD